MTKYERNDLLRHTRISDLFEENQAKISSVPSLVAAHAEHKTLINEINETDKQYLAVTEGMTRQKNEAEIKLAENACIASNVVRSYALSTNNLNLAENNDWTCNKLLKLADLDTLNKIKGIRDDATANIAALADYGYTEQDLADLNAEIADYEKYFSDKGLSFTDRSAYRKRLTELFSRINTLLQERITLVMTVFSKKDPDFYNKFVIAGTLVEYGTRHEEPETTTDAPETET